MSSMREEVGSSESKFPKRLGIEVKSNLSHFKMTIFVVKYHMVKLRKWLLGKIVNFNNYKIFKFILSDDDIERYKVEKAIAFSDMTSIFKVGDVVKIVSETKHKNSVFTIDRIAYDVGNGLKKHDNGKLEIVLKAKPLFYCGNNTYSEKQIIHHRMGKRKKLTI